ncbi:Protein of unknown function [Pyronema omphalodes CBS 100304]|uniref:Uncharacterized protein n=1 Tax=Pyronema omphalodes (strain CBS 100304) TaxID=1076935 RepID=U4L5Y0_PYROM|nr:Protein of unknown function [Pyronema omphalodes CBS 100304]
MEEAKYLNAYVTAAFQKCSCHINMRILVPEFNITEFSHQITLQLTHQASTLSEWYFPDSDPSPVPAPPIKL